MATDPGDLLSALEGALSFEGASRPYLLEASAPLDQLMVEAWSLQESLDHPFELHITALSVDATLDIQAMLGQTVTLQGALADGSLSSRSAIVFEADSEEADGGLARYRLVCRPWLGLLAHTRRSQVWQEQTTVQILESIFARYSAHAQWRWADDVRPFLDQSPYAGSGDMRSYTVQYRESDLAFVSRMLAEEGLSFRWEEEPEAPAKHRLVIFADSTTVESCPEDETSKAGAGIRFHRSSAVEQSDSVQAFGGVRILQAATTTVLSWDYAAKRSVAASVPTNHSVGGKNAPRLEAYRPQRAYAYATNAQAERAATLAQEVIEARNKRWIGRSTVRTLQPGRRFDLLDSPLDQFNTPSDDTPSNRPSDPAEQTRFVVTKVVSIGISHLPKQGTSGGAGIKPELFAPWVDEALLQQAAKTGFANHFEANRAYITWRPEPVPRPKAPGALLADVVGPNGETTPEGNEEIHTDRMGRVKIRHHFQKPGEGSTWVRVLQPMAGSGLGAQFIPRIGQQVLVDFFDDDMERPFVRGALYTGKGEGGVAATPGGTSLEKVAADAKATATDAATTAAKAATTAALAKAAAGSVFALASDCKPGGQGNLSCGNSPPWHAASPESKSAGGQQNAGALSGWKTKEFGGPGFNQLVFDDSNGQLRTQLATSQYASQLNMGYLIHQADNHRGSFRGLGFELRTDAYGVLRGGRGLLLSSFGITPATPSGDNVAGIALAAQMKGLLKQFNDQAQKHETLPLASATGTGKPNHSALSAKEAEGPALHTALKGMGDAKSFEQASSDAAAKVTATGPQKVPQLTDPLVAISAKAGLAITGDDLIVAAGEHVVLGAGQDLSQGTGGSARIHSGQAIGVLGGAVAPGTDAVGTGMTLIAGQGDVAVQAQADKMQIAAKSDVAIQSQHGAIDWVAAKKITLRTKGGASVVIEGGNITVMCPGELRIKASVKKFEGPEGQSYSLPAMPAFPLTICIACLKKSLAAAPAFTAME